MAKLPHGTAIAMWNLRQRQRSSAGFHIRQKRRNWRIGFFVVDSKNENTDV
jgi:hypothetical protein